MLLRLLPAPTATQANPPTILFTLPLPTQPYIARSLPLPPNFLAHRSVCLQEDIDCPNVLLGDKASWITGIIDDVTFSLIALTVTINYIDGTSTSYPVESACAVMLHKVCKEVELSFAPAPPTIAETTPAHSQSSSSSSSSSRPSIVSPTARRSPSSLLFSLLSPLLPNSASASLPPRIPPARVHRRQARSFLVDTFRQFVLPTLKRDLPAAYLPWSIHSEVKRRMAAFEKLRGDVDQILEETGVAKGVEARAPLRRYRTFSAGDDFSDDAMSDRSDRSGDLSPSASASSLITPATSIYSSSEELPTPQSFLLSIPPAHALPLSYQPAYTVLLQRLTHIASRLHSIKRLDAKYEKEESKRAWLEGVERSRAADKAIRRALSNGELKGLRSMTVEPMKRTSLGQSWSAADQELLDQVEARRIHPVVMARERDEPELSSDSDSDDIELLEDAETPLTPTSTIYSHRAITIRIPVPTNLDTCYEAEIEGERIAMLSQARRPSLERTSTPRQVTVDVDVDGTTSDEDVDEPIPSLCASSSSESLSSGDWDEEVRTPSPPPMNDASQLPDHMVVPVPTKLDGFNWGAAYPAENEVEVEGDVDMTMTHEVRPKSRLGFRRGSATYSSTAPSAIEA